MESSPNPQGTELKDSGRYVKRPINKTLHGLKGAQNLKFNFEISPSPLKIEDFSNVLTLKFKGLAYLLPKLSRLQHAKFRVNRRNSCKLSLKFPY
jgi:hypothetical protein